MLVAVSGISFPTLASFYEGQKLRQAAIELQSHLLRARALAQRQRSTCNLSISSGATVQVTGSGACATLPTLNLTAEVGVRGLCIRDTDGGPSPCTAPAAINFLSLGVLQGSGQTLFLAGTATSAQACVNLSLTLIRVGYRQATSGACTYSGS